VLRCSSYPWSWECSSLLIAWMRPFPTVDMRTRRSGLCSASSIIFCRSDIGSTAVIGQVLAPELLDRFADARGEYFRRKRLGRDRFHSRQGPSVGGFVPTSPATGSNGSRGTLNRMSHSPDRRCVALESKATRSGREAHEHERKRCLTRAPVSTPAARRRAGCRERRHHDHRRTRWPGYPRPGSQRVDRGPQLQPRLIPQSGLRRTSTEEAVS
jgi:hypothetical protein